MKRSLLCLSCLSLLGAGLAAWVAAPVQPAALQVAELKTVVVPPPPPPPVDSNTVDLRDKKEPLIPHIPNAAAQEVELRQLAGAAPDNRTIFYPPPPPPPPTV